MICWLLLWLANLYSVSSNEIPLKFAYFTPLPFPSLCPHYLLCWEVVLHQYFIAFWWIYVETHKCVKLGECCAKLGDRLFDTIGAECRMSDGEFSAYLFNQSQVVGPVQKETHRPLDRDFIFFHNKKVEEKNVEWGQVATLHILELSFAIFTSCYKHRRLGRGLWYLLVTWDFWHS